MTACKEAQGATPGKKAVGATLAGVLAVGMVPAAAFAAEAPADGAQDDGIDLLDTVDAATAFNNGSVTSVKNAKNQTETVGEDGLTYTYTGKNLAVQVASVQPAAGDAIDTTGNGWKTTIYQASSAADAESIYIGNGKTVTAMPVANASAVGTYYAVVKATAGNAAYYTAGASKVSLGIEFKVAAKALKDVVSIYDASANDTADTAFTYNGGKQKIGVLLNGAVFNLNGVTGATDITSVKYYKKGTSTSGDVIAAGDYTAQIVGGGAYAGQTAYVDFTVGKLDLSQAVIVTKANKYAPNDTIGTLSTYVESIDGTPTEQLAGNIDAKFVSGPEGVSVNTKENGTYTYELSAKKGVDGKDNPNVTGTATIAFDYVDAVVPSSDFTYDGKPMSDYSAKDAALEVDLSGKKKDLFDADNIAVAGLDAEKGEYSVKVTKADGSEAAISDLDATPGLYYVQATVNAAKFEYAKGGSAGMWVKVTKGNVAANANVYVTYDGTAASSFSAIYTGKDFLDEISVTVKDAKGNVVDPADYKVTVTDGKGRTVTEVVNSDTYTITVTSDTYTISGEATCKFEVSPVDVKTVRVAGQVEFGSTALLPYTGEAIVPTFEYVTNEDAVAKGAKAEWAELPADTYDIVKYELDKDGKAPYAYKTVDGMKDAGWYAITLAEADDVVNYSFGSISNSGRVGVLVSDAKVFADVANGTWYAKSVYDAAKLQYMGGYAGTKLFGPNDSITRGQVACVLYNMAVPEGEDAIPGFAPVYDENQGVVTGFSDVDGKQYYAFAIAWAEQAGVINGYGDGTFAPDAPVTREEFAAMLGNYAAAQGDFEVKDADAALAAFEDGNAVSGWAEESVAWAVENKVMGNGGFIAPAAPVSRAEVAAMVVNYQPERPTYLG